MQDLSRLHDAAEDADFPILDPDPVGVAGGMAKIKVTYSLVLLMGISVVCMTCTCHAPFEAAECADFPKLSSKVTSVAVGHAALPDPSWI